MSPPPPSPADAPARHSAGRDHARRTTPGSRDTFGLTTRSQPSVCLRYHSSPTTGAGTILRSEYAIGNFYVKPQHMPLLSVATHGTASAMVAQETSMANPRLTPNFIVY